MLGLEVRSYRLQSLRAGESLLRSLVKDYKALLGRAAARVLAPPCIAKLCKGYPSFAGVTREFCLYSSAMLEEGAQQGIDRVDAKARVLLA